MENLRSLLKSDKYKITSWNKNLVRMDLFKSFITVPLQISRDHLGSCNGWTRVFNEEYKLIIGGGIYNGVNYLNDIQYGVKQDNPYNNYVNPFYLFDIMTNEGKNFFIDYYKEDIDKILKDKKSNIEFIKESIKVKEYELDVIKNELLNFLK